MQKKGVPTDKCTCAHMQFKSITKWPLRSTMGSLLSTSLSLYTGSAKIKVSMSIVNMNFAQRLTIDFLSFSGIDIFMQITQQL